jgi:NADPH:quinone reductase-like Zn-dependent oxidoreductase
MRAIILRGFGGPEVLEVTELERPEPAAGEVLVRVEAVGLNPVEAFARSGALPLFGPPPIVLGWDVAGVVEAAGPGVDRFAPGDRVFGMPRFPRLAHGYAEYVAAPAAELARPPADLDPVHAAALPLVGLTVWQSLVGAAAIEPGQHVLVHAGGGGVGHLAVQLAKARGARVTATASEGKRAFVEELGADTVVDYRSEDVASRVRDVDVVLDPIGGDVAEQSVPLVRPGGTIVSLLRHHDEDELKARVESTGRRFVGHLVSPDGPGLEALAALVDDGTLRVHVARTFGFDEIAEAHRLLDASPGQGSGTGITGKLVAVP